MTKEHTPCLSAEDISQTTMTLKIVVCENDDAHPQSSHVIIALSGSVHNSVNCRSDACMTKQDETRRGQHPETCGRREISTHNVK